MSGVDNAYDEIRVRTEGSSKRVEEVGRGCFDVGGMG